MRSLIPARFSAMLLGAFLIIPGAVQAQSGSFDDVHVSYHGGPLLQNVEVSTLFWGSYWRQNSLADYFNGFYQALFADGGYLQNLAQYSAGGYQIGNGQFVASALDSRQPPSRVTEAQIQAEIRAGVEAGVLPPPDGNSLYVVITPPSVTAVLSDGSHSGSGGFGGYHNYASNGQFAYAEIASDGYRGDLTPMTFTMSHELAEAVTDPLPWKGWYDKKYQEIGDVVEALYGAKRIGFEEYVDSLQGANGTRYEVAKVWSAADGMPVAFAAGHGPGFGSFR